MSAEHEAAILSDLRRTHAQLKKTAPSSTPAQGNGVHGWSMRLTVEEVDLLLAIVDERDELKRQACDDWEGQLRKPLLTDPPVLTDDQVTMINTCPHAGTHHNCPLGGCPSFERREVIGNPVRCEATPGEWLDHAEHYRCEKDAGHEGDHEHTPRGDANGVTWAAPVGREARETPPKDLETLHCLSTANHGEHVWGDGRRSARCPGFDSSTKLSSIFDVDPTA